jgi:hypothetical protein
MLNFYYKSNEDSMKIYQSLINFLHNFIMFKSRTEANLKSLNNPENYLITREVTNLPIGHDFPILKVFADTNKYDNATNLILDHGDFLFDDAYEKESFIIVLGTPFEKINLFGALSELMQKKDGQAFIKVLRIKTLGYQHIPVFGFSFRKNIISEDFTLEKCAASTSKIYNHNDETLCHMIAG